MDFDDDVLYCYEIQLEESLRRKGIGMIREIFLYLSLSPSISLIISLSLYCYKIQLEESQEERNRYDKRNIPLFISFTLFLSSFAFCIVLLRDTVGGFSQ